MATGLAYSFFLIHKKGHRACGFLYGHRACGIFSILFWLSQRASARNLDGSSSILCVLLFSHPTLGRASALRYLCFDSRYAMARCQAATRHRGKNSLCGLQDLYLRGDY
jgi:hypothetical protein